MVFLYNCIDNQGALLFKDSSKRGLLGAGAASKARYLIDCRRTNPVCVAGSVRRVMNHLSRQLHAGIFILSSLWAAVEPSGAEDRRPKLIAPQQLISKQAPPMVNHAVLAQMNPENASVLVSLSRQRAYVYAAGQLAIDTPISSGKKAGFTPTGHFTIIQKDPNHRSNIYGNFVDSRGRIIRAGVSSRIDSAPSGTHYEGAPMLYFMRLTSEGVGMHVGILPGYPASHGCIRMPAEIAPQIYSRVKLGTPVQVMN
jgi:lipoprotein-anchoring transpeptidase ErfK/SrfK